MRTSEVAALALAIAVCLPCSAAENAQSEPLPGAAVSIAALVAAQLFHAARLRRAW